MDSALHTIDWVILGAYLLLALGLGSFFFRQASSGVESFFVGDRNLPWWLAGTSIVATTFAADTPLAVTGIVASGGISGNWIWWSWAIAHLTSTFLFARLWRRSGVITDAEITELRYGGRAAAVLRGFKAVYWGLFINCLIMAWVIKAMVKIAQALFDVPAGAVIGAAVSVCVLYTTLGGYRSVVLTDLFQFGLGMAGAVVLAVFVVRDFGGLGSAGAAPGAGGLLPQLERVLAAGGRELEDVLAMVPRSDHPTMPLVAFVVLLLAGWWRYAEGNGYIVQRLASCRSEQDAQGAALWFSVAHNSLRPWPWIVVALAALVVYPQLAPAPPAAIELEGPSSVVITPGHLDVAGGGSVQVRGAPPGSRLTILDQSRRLERAADGSLRAWFARFGGSAVTAVELEAPDGRRWRGAGFVVQLADREMAYPLMVRRYLPAGVLGLVLASLVAAFMSTIDTHTNWGASYLVQDLYRRSLHRADGAARRRRGPHYRKHRFGVAVLDHLGRRARQRERGALVLVAGDAACRARRDGGHDGLGLDAAVVFFADLVRGRQPLAGARARRLAADRDHRARQPGDLDPGLAAGAAERSGNPAPLRRSRSSAGTGLARLSGGRDRIDAARAAAVAGRRDRGVRQPVRHRPSDPGPPAVGRRSLDGRRAGLPLDPALRAGG